MDPANGRKPRQTYYQPLREQEDDNVIRGLRNAIFIVVGGAVFAIALSTVLVVCHG